jgi:hypothetical protein
MHGPALIGWLLVTVCGSAGAHCLLRMRHDTPRQRPVSALEALMGWGMAAMAVPASVLPLPPPLVFAAVFAAVAGWSLGLLRSGAPHQLHHLVESLAMIYMALAMAAVPGAAHAGHAADAGGLPLLTGALLVYFATYALHTGVRLLPATPTAPGAPVPPGLLRQPEVAEACRLTLALGMFAMLIAL